MLNIASRTLELLPKLNQGLSGIKIYARTQCFASWTEDYAILKDFYRDSPELKEESPYVQVTFAQTLFKSDVEKFLIEWFGGRVEGNMVQAEEAVFIADPNDSMDRGSGIYIFLHWDSQELEIIRKKEGEQLVVPKTNRISDEELKAISDWNPNKAIFHVSFETIAKMARELIERRKTNPRRHS